MTFFVKRWDCQEDFESVKTIGETQAYHNLLLVAYEKNNVELLEIILSEMGSEHFSLLKMYTYFRMNFVKGNYEICRCLFDYFKISITKNFYKINTLEIKENFLNMVELYLECYSVGYDSAITYKFSHDSFKEFILYIEKYIFELNDKDYIKNVKYFYKNVLLP